jgi:hypothetical protein
MQLGYDQRVKSAGEYLVSPIESIDACDRFTHMYGARFILIVFAAVPFDGSEEVTCGAGIAVSLLGTDYHSQFRCDESAFQRAA